MACKSFYVLSPIDFVNDMISRTEIGSVSQAVVHEKARTNGEWRYTPFREGYNYHKIPTGEEGKFQLVVLVSLYFTISDSLSILITISRIY